MASEAPQTRGARTYSKLIVGRCSIDDTPPRTHETLRTRASRLGGKHGPNECLKREGFQFFFDINHEGFTASFSPGFSRICAWAHYLHLFCFTITKIIHTPERETQ